MDALKGIIQKILGANPSLKQGVEEVRILELWGISVGEQIAKHAKAVQVKETTLLVSVDHPIWKQELHSNKRLALSKFNEKLKEVLGPPPEPREDWILDLFFVSPNPINANPSKEKLKYPRR